MTVLAVLTVLESTLHSFCLSYKAQDTEGRLVASDALVQLQLASLHLPLLSELDSMLFSILFKHLWKHSGNNLLCTEYCFCLIQP